MSENLLATMQALMSRPEPGSTPAPVPSGTPTGAPSNANTPTHIGSAPTPAPAAPAPTPAQPTAAQPGGDLTPEQLRERYDNVRAALAEARAIARTNTRDMDALRADNQRLNANLQTLLAQRASAPPPQAPAAPAVPVGIDLAAIESDPLGTVKALAQFANALLAERQQQALNAHQQQRQHTAQRQQQQGEAQRMQRAALALQDSEAELREAFPDYDEAANHYISVRMFMLESTGMEREQAANAIQWELLNSSEIALNQGLSPARAIYDAARAMGYGRSQVPTPPPAPPAPPPAPARVDPLANIRDGQVAAQSAGIGAGGENNPLDISAINQLSGAAFRSASRALIDKMRGVTPL